MGRFRRTLVCQPLIVEELQLETPRDWYLSGATYDQFSHQLERLMAMSDAEYSLKYQLDIEYFAGPRNSIATHILLEELIAECMKVYN